MARSPLFVLFLTVFLDLLGFGIVLPLLPFYAIAYHGTAFEVGALMAIYSLMQFVFSPLWGRLSDRVGRRPVLMISIVGSIGGFLLLGAAASIPMLFVARLFSGIMGATIGVAQAYIADVTTPENRAKGMGLIGAAFGLGFVFGPALGGLLSGTSWGPGLPMYAAAGLATLNLAFASLKLPESLPAERRGHDPARLGHVGRIGRALRVEGLGLLMLLALVTVFAFATMESTFSLLTLQQFQYHERENGWLFTYLGVLIVILQGGLVGRLARRFGEKRLVVAGCLLLAVGLGALPWASPSLAVLLLVLVPLAVGNGLVNPSLAALVSRTAEASAQGEVLGVNQSMASLGRILGPLWGGFAFSRFDPRLTYAVAGGLMLLLAVAAAGIRAPKPTPEAS